MHQNSTNYIRAILNYILNKEFFLVIAARFIQLLGSFLVLKILSTQLTIIEFGHYSLVLSILTLISLLPFSAFDQGVVRYVSIYRDKGIFNYFYSNCFIPYFALLAVYTLFWIVLSQTVLLDSYWSTILWALPVFISSEIIKTSYLMIEYFDRERLFTLVTISIEFSLKCLSPIAIKFYSKSLSTLDVLSVFAVINLLILLMTFYKRRQSLRISLIKTKYIRIFNSRIFKFSYPLLTWAIFGWLQSMGNRWFLNLYSTKEMVAKYSLLSSVANIPTTAIIAIVSGYIVPIIYQKENEKRGFASSFLKITIPSLSVILTCFVVIFHLFSYEIITIISNENYASISKYLPVLLFSNSLVILADISTYEIYAHNQTRRLIRSKIFPGMFSLIFGLILTKNYGLHGAITNHLLTNIILAALILNTTIKYNREAK
ncbi:hypothetical protein BIY24_01775 [Halobacteriovorax marinus]|uniref:lipopolysaccharide biosynthesis protein n=1 Tax=Halobacteriovorax marinus TaxID=97084 RepID=UPI000BC2EE79|nr:oligosaccharide flippase family protein [Halobacteriovorax marinus]ATH06710.1 hypothetical protein BIY24_01775 [Halobacteriovorax marinus]